MADNVRSIRGGDVPAPGQADSQVVKALEDALAAARRGEALSVAVVYVAPGEKVYTRYAGAQSRMALIGGIALMQCDLMAEWD